MVVDTPGEDYHTYCDGFDPDDIVISGMSGRFPSCHNVEELKNGLYNQTELIKYSNERFEKGTAGLPFSSHGLIPDLNRFDHEYFRMPFIAAENSDPAMYVHLEVVAETLMDAGYDPIELRGKYIGVYTAMLYNDAAVIRCNKPERMSGMLGLLRTMIPNRVSHVFDFKGPSYTVDSACSSSAVSFYNAVENLRRGEVEMAIVSGCEINLNPMNFYSYWKGGILADIGKSLPFDKDSNGLIRCESVTAILLQKASSARRAYAKVLGCKFHSTGHMIEGISHPSLQQQILSMRMLLSECGVSPHEVDYVEGHGTGTSVGDPIEMNAVAETFITEGRDRPIYIGTIKSNIGHTEAAAGVCSVIKALLAFETGVVSSNWKFNNPNPDCQAALDGTLKVVTTPLTLKNPYIPVNCFGFGGTDIHILIKQNMKEPVDNKTTMQNGVQLPKLVLACGRTKEAVASILNSADKTQSPDHLVLLNKIAFEATNLKPFRGYTLLHGDENAEQYVQECVPKERPLWFVMTGMGCQWPGMGLQLMCLPPFAESMQKSAKSLKTVGIDLFELVRADGDHLTRTRNITPAFVSITAIQIALIDLLHHMNIHPDGIVGHSHGELASAYADGCITSEEAILSAYCKGFAVDNGVDLIPGAMAAIGLPYEEVCSRCPPEVYAACDNSDSSVTISGPTASVESFVEILKQEKVFARIVDAYGYAFHCQHIHPAMDALRKGLEKVLKNPKPRSKRWISSSYPEEEWEDSNCKVAGVEYFVHNLMSRVRFKDAVKFIPKHAITIEIGPHFLLQSILRRSMGSEAAFIGLMKRNEPDNINFLMNSLGKFYCEGGTPKVEYLYPPIKFPVCRGTPMISSKIIWNHTKEFSVPKFDMESSDFQASYELVGSDGYLMDHFIDGRSLFPATGLIMLAWQALASKSQKSIDEVVPVIQNFKIHRATILNQKANPSFSVGICKGSGEFDDFSIIEGNGTIATGSIKDHRGALCWPDIVSAQDNDDTVPGTDIYSEIRISGYEYGPEFRALQEVNMDASGGKVLFSGKWIPFLDAMLLFFGIIHNQQGFRLPTGALNFTIDPKKLLEYIKQQGQEACPVPVSYQAESYTVWAPGVKIVRLQTDPAPLRGKQVQASLEEYRFVPYDSVYQPRGPHDRQLKQHMAACNSVIQQIKEGMGKKLGSAMTNFKFDAVEDPDFDADAYLEELESNEKGLFSILLEISQTSVKDFEAKREEWIKSFEEKIGRDVINSCLSSEAPLRMMLDIILENNYRKLSALEINLNFRPVLMDIQDILKDQLYMKLKSSTLIWRGEPADLEEESLSERGITILKPNSAIPGNQDLVIGSFYWGDEVRFRSILNEMCTSVRPRGLLLLFLKEQTSGADELVAKILGVEVKIPQKSAYEKIISEFSLISLARVTDNCGNSMHLLRRSLPIPVSIPPVVMVSEENFEWVEELKTNLYGEHATQSSTVWLVADNHLNSGIIGLVNCLKHEPGAEKVRCAFIRRGNSGNNVHMSPFNLQNPIYQQLLTQDLVMNVWTDGKWGSFRHFSITDGKQERPHENSFIECTKLGDLSSFRWLESPLLYRPKNESNEIVHVHYSALNFKDVMIASGKLNPGTSVVSEECYSLLGLEYSGLDSRGRRVAGMVEGGALATTISVPRDQLIQIPDKWTLEQAATVPVVYTTAYYALLLRGNLEHGESVLIHSATGGVGLAACQIALSMGCEVFATVGNDEKHKYLKQLFPQLKDGHIGCSRNTSFEEMIMKETKGKGVDIVLNSLADDKFQSSVRCLGQNGRFLEIGKYDMMMDRNLGLRPFLKNITFHGVFLDVLMSSKIQQITKVIRMMQDGINSGVVKPLEATVYGRDQAEDAFRYMTKGVHVGKVLIKIRDQEDTKGSKNILRIPSLPITYLYPNKVYIIIGGLGGFGVELAKWMLTRGAKNVVLTSRFGVRSAYHRMCMKRWGSHVRVSTRDVSKREDAEQLLKECSQIAPVGGIYNCAVVLKDSFMDKGNAADFMAVCGPKATASKYLDELSRQLCPQMDHFVCFSSISCGRGNAGQTNYGFSNSVMERVCEQRKKDGLHGLAIQWGIIGDVGVVHRHMGDDAKIAGVSSQSLRSCLDTLEIFLQSQWPVVTSYVVARSSKSALPTDMINRICRVLGVNDVSEVNSNLTFGELGIDSMVGVELRQLIESTCNVMLSVQEIQEMKMEDMRRLLEKADSDDAMPLFVSTSANLPTTIRHENPCIVLHEDNAKNEKTPLFVVHISDIDVEKLKPLSKVFNSPAYALVWTKDAPTSDLSAVADWYLKIIEQRVGSGTFHLAGHGMGGTVALQMAIQSKQEVESVVLVNASEGVTAGLSGEEDVLSEEDALCRFVEQFIADGVPRLNEELKQLENTEQKVTRAVSALGVTTGEVMEAAADFGARLKLSRTAVIGRIDKDLLVLEDPEIILANDIKDIIVPLSQICKGKVNVQRVIDRRNLESQECIQRMSTALKDFLS